jgi:hypothetical protein
MGRLFTTRRAEWLPGLALLGAAVGIGALLGLSVDTRSWFLLGGVLVGGIAAAGVAEILARRRRREMLTKPLRTREGFRVIDGGKAAPGYDLEQDRSTDSQRWLM